MKINAALNRLLSLILVFTLISTATLIVGFADEQTDDIYELSSEGSGELSEDFTDEPSNEPTDEPSDEPSGDLPPSQDGDSDNFDKEYGNPADWCDENGYITSTYGYPIQGDPYVEETEIYSFTGSQIMDWNAGTVGTREEILNSGNATFYNMSDEIFFGKWDADTESWLIEGKINYEAYPGLAPTEECIKQGDYEGAKAEYLEYYREKERLRNRPRNKTTSTTGRIQAELLTKNFMYNHMSGFTPLALIDVEETPKTYSVDVTETVSKYKGKREELTFWIVATDKDGGMAEFFSRESGVNIPTLTVIVNGTKRVYTPSADTYISAGANTGKSFGLEETLKASESTTADEYRLVDANTNRIHIKFDVSDIKASDTVSAASMEVYGSNTSENGKTKQVVVFYSDDSTWDESLIYYRVPSNIFSYDQLASWMWVGPGVRQVEWGSRYMEETLRFSGWYGGLVEMYNATGDDKYAYTLLRILMDFINVTGQHTRYMKDLDIAVRCMSIQAPFMQLLDNKFMTPDIFTGFMKYMWIEGNEFMQFFTNGSNWGVMERNGHYTMILEYPEFTDSEKWLKDVRQRFYEVIKSSVLDDGSCSEFALGYVWVNITNVLGAIDTMKATGLDDAPEAIDERTIELTNQLTRYMMDMSMPGYRDNQEGDSDSHNSLFKNRFMQMYNISGDPVLYYGATNGQDGTRPDYTSIAYRGQGKKVAMRTDWDSDALYLYSAVDGSQGSHAHQDDNHVIVYAYGQYLLVDPLYGSYSGGTVENWLKSAQAHNTVTVNDNNHASSADVDIVNWETNQSYDFATMKTGNATGADLFERSILFVKPGFWLVNDYLEPTDKENANTYSQTWHFLPEANPEFDNNTKVARTTFNKANIQVVPVNYDIFSNAGLKDGWYSSGMGSMSSAEYLSYEKRLKGNAVFNTVLYPEKIGDEFEITTETIAVEGLSDSQASCYDLYITDTKKKETNHSQYWQLHDKSKNATRTVGSFTTDASLLYAEFDNKGNAVRIIARDVSYIKNNENNKIVLQSDSAFEELSLSYEGTFCNLDSSVLTQKVMKNSNVVIAKGEKNVRSVMLNGEKTGYSATENFIYFGAKPEDEDSDDTHTSSRPSSAGNIHGSSNQGLSILTDASVVTPNTDDVGYFIDVAPNHWAKQAIEELHKDGIINGREENIYAPDDDVTRAEFTALIVRSLNVKKDTYTGSFEDVDNNCWYADEIETALNLGIISKDITFRPNDSITREEMAKIVVSAKELSSQIVMEEIYKMDFADSHLIADWAEVYVAKASFAELLLGDENGNFNPKNKLSRAESAMVVYRLLK